MNKLIIMFKIVVSLLTEDIKGYNSHSLVKVHYEEKVLKHMKHENVKVAQLFRGVARIFPWGGPKYHFQKPKCNLGEYPLPPGISHPGGVGTNLRSGVLFSEERERKATRDSAVSQALVRREKSTPDTFTARVVCRQSRIWTFVWLIEKQKSLWQFPWATLQLVTWLHVWLPVQFQNKKRLWRPSREMRTANFLLLLLRLLTERMHQKDY